MCEWFTILVQSKIWKHNKFGTLALLVLRELYESELYHIYISNIKCAYKFLVLIQLSHDFILPNKYYYNYMYLQES